MLKKNLLILTLFFAVLSLQAQVKISGTITDADNGETLIGATIIEKGTSNGTITDFDGKFEMEVSSKDAVLEFSYTGYSNMEKSLEGGTALEIQMDLDAANLNEVIVIGYGTQTKKELTGAITKVTAEDLEDMPATRLEDALGGRTSGVRVTANSGQPGDGGTVRIRGTTTIGDSNPLYVVDGVVIGGGIDFLNSGDIKSIEVLKDAASAAIYGARAANGVILVTTKNGLPDRTEVSYRAYTGFGAPWKKLALLNATEYGILMNESSVAAGGSVLFEDPQSLGEGTDWQDAIFNDNASIQNHELSISSGSKRSQYYASFGFTDLDGIISADRSQYQRFTARLNSTHKINKHVTFGNTIGYSRVSARGIATNSEFGSPLSRAVNLDPLTPILETDPDELQDIRYRNPLIVRNEDGIPYGISENVTSEVLNPLAGLAIENGYGWSDKIVGNAFVEVAFLDGFKFKSSIGTDLAFWGNEGFQPTYYLNSSNTRTVNSYSRQKNNGLAYIFQNTLSYEKKFGEHKVGGVFGAVAEQNSGEGIGGSIQDIPVNNIEDASFGFANDPTTQSFFGFEYLSRTASYFGRINYGYNSKYLLSVVLRRDGSSRFGGNYKFGNFPGFSVGWVASDENFLVGNSVLNYLKFRGSYGVNGNDRIGDFRYASTVGGGRNYTFGLDEQLALGFSPNAIANPDLRWEQTSQINIGFDAKIFKRISVTFDVFEKKTKDMLLDIQVPFYVGNDGPIGNIATLENRGVELELGYLKVFNKLEVDFSGNISYLENKITSLGLDKDFQPGQRFGPQGLEISRTTVGEPIGHFYGFETDGIFQNQAEVDAYVNADGGLIQPDASPGDIRFKDLNGNGILDEDDQTKIGDPTPTWTYGLNLALAYKGFDIMLFGQGVGGSDVFKATRRFDLQMANMTADALDRWTGEGTSDTYPRLVMNDPNRNFSRSSDFYVEKGDYFRIKTLQLGYTLPDRMTKKAGFKKVRFYASGNNLFTATQYSGFDPEIGGGSFGVDRGFYQQPRYFLFGINATFFEREKFDDEK